jgi:hypothetical protein
MNRVARTTNGTRQSDICGTGIITKHALSRRPWQVNERYGDLSSTDEPLSIESLSSAGKSFSKETVDHQLKPENTDRSDGRFSNEDLDSVKPTGSARADKCPQRSCSECYGGRD